MNEPALVDIVHELGLGRVQRAGNRAGALAFGFLAQVDQRDVGPADQRLRLRGGLRPAAARTSSWCRPWWMLAGTATSIIFGLGRLRPVISWAYSSASRT